MIDITFKITNAILPEKARALLEQGGLPNTANAINESAEFIQEEWKNRADTTFQHSTGSYRNAIQIEGMADPKNLFSKVVNRLPYAAALENGMSSAERMQILQTSHQVRISKKGHRYLIIPFRHGTPGTTTMPPMPKSVHKLAKNLTVSKRTGTRHELSQQLVTMGNIGKARKHTEHGVPLAQRFNYREPGTGKSTWGGRLTGVGGNWEGMYKFGEKGQTQYTTFRVMSENGKPWGGIPAFRLAKKTANQTRQQVIANIKAGYKQDLTDIFDGARA